MKRIVAAAVATIALTLTACGGNSYAAAYDELSPVDGVDEELFTTIAKSSCDFYAMNPPEFYERNGLPTADEALAIAVAEGSGMHMADARYVVRMAGLNVCPDAAKPHLYQD